MDNKLSKPVAYMTAEGVAITHLDFESGSWGMHNAAKSDDMWCPLYSQEYVSALLAELEAKDKRILELDYLRLSASEVFKEIGNELGCNPDNESIMMAIDDLKNDNTSLRDQRAGLAREANELEARAKVWESAATKHLARAEEAEKRLATPVRLPRTLWYEHDDLAHEIPVLEKKKVVAEIRAAGFTVEGDEQ